ncbi:hypothetical protein D3C80_2068410 [compost metagenome]
MTLASNSSEVPASSEKPKSVLRMKYCSPASHTISSVIATRVAIGQRISSSRVQMVASNSTPITSSASGSGQNRLKVI